MLLGEGGGKGSGFFRRARLVGAAAELVDFLDRRLRRVAVDEVLLGVDVEDAEIGLGHLRLARRLDRARRIARIELLEAARDLEQRILHRLEGARRAVLALAAQGLERLEVVGERGDDLDVADLLGAGARTGRAARIGAERGLGRLSGRLDDIFVVGGEVLLDRGEAVVEFARTGLNRTAGDLAGEIGDLFFQATQDVVIAREGRRGGPVELGGNVGEAGFEPVDAGIGDRLHRRGRDRLVEPAGNIGQARFETLHSRQRVDAVGVALGAADQRFEPADDGFGNGGRPYFGALHGVDALGKVVEAGRKLLADIDGADALDLAGQLGDLVGQPRQHRALTGARAGLEHALEMGEPRVEAPDRLVIGELRHAVRHRVEAPADISRQVERLHGLHLLGERADARFQALDHRGVDGGRRLRLQGGDGAGDLVEPLSKEFELARHVARWQARLPRKFLDRGGKLGDAGVDLAGGAALRHGGELVADVVDPVGEIDDVVAQAVDVDAGNPVLDRLPARFERTEAVLAGEPVDGRAHGVELEPERIGRAVAAVDAVDAGGNARELAAQVVGHAGVERFPGEAVKFAAKGVELAGKARADVGLQFAAHLGDGFGKRLDVLVPARQRVLAPGLRSGLSLGGGGIGRRLRRPAAGEHVLAGPDRGDRIVARAHVGRLTATALPHQPLDACLKALDGPVQGFDRGVPTAAVARMISRSVHRPVRSAPQGNPPRSELSCGLAVIDPRS